MTEATEGQVRNWVRDEVGDIKSDLRAYTDNRKEMFSYVMVALVALALLALIGFTVHEHKSDVEQCAVSCGTAGMKAWSRGYDVHVRDLGTPNYEVQPDCTCYEAKQP